MTQKQPTAGIVLAAGMSTRMGTTKQLLDVGGKILLARVVETALRSELARVILVLGHEADRVAAALGPLVVDRRLSIVVNERYEEGMASSLQAGLRPIQDDFPSVMFLLGDQPFLQTSAIDLLLRRFWDSNKGICVPLYGTRRGNPVLFSRHFYNRILAIHGDRGAREIILTHSQDVLFVELDDPLCFLDIDSVEDVRKLAPVLPPTSTRKRPDPSP